MRIHWGALSVAAAIAVGIAATAASPAAAGVSAPCGAHGVLSASGATLTCTYTAAGEDTFTPPAGVASVSVVAIGGAGGAGGPYPATFIDGGPGGDAASVSAPSVSVSGLATLYVEVGADGSDGGLNGSNCNAGPGGSGGGGAGGPANCDGAGGGGGGASDLRTQPATAGGLTASTGDPRLVVAGGGGGGGGAIVANGAGGGASGGSAGGGAGAGGTGGCFTASGANGALGQTGSGGGAPGSGSSDFMCADTNQEGSAGTPGQGGAGGNGTAGDGAAGGGGGGGYVGGGGGGVGFPGAGGGGGSSFGPAGTTFTTTSTATPPSVAISWVAAAPQASVSAPAAGATFTEGQTASETFVCTDGTGGTGISTCLDENGAASGAALNTATLGAHTVTVTATSADGHTSQASVNYNVVAPASTPAAAQAPAAPAALLASSAAVPAGGIDPFLIDEWNLPVRVACGGGQTACSITVGAAVSLRSGRVLVTLPATHLALDAQQWTTVHLADPARLSARIRDYLRHHRAATLRIAVLVSMAQANGAIDTRTYSVALHTLPGLR